MSTSSASNAHHQGITGRHRPRDTVTRLFAAALDDDPVADDALRRHAIAGDPTAVVAFRALCVAEIERERREHHQRSGPVR